MDLVIPHGATDVHTCTRLWASDPSQTDTVGRLDLSLGRRDEESAHRDLSNESPRLETKGQVTLPVIVERGREAEVNITLLPTPISDVFEEFRRHS